MHLTAELKKEYLSLLGKSVHVTMDRPIGSIHPKHPEIVYPINYGYVEGLIGGDGEEQDVYVLDESEPLETFEGVIVAVVHRYDDDECKWVAIAKGKKVDKQYIENAVHFQEQFHDSEIVVK